MRVNPDGDVFVLDGSYSSKLGVTLPDLVTNLCVFFDPAQLLKAYVDDNKFLVVSSESKGGDPFSDSSSLESLVVSGSFFTNNSGGSLSASLEGNILYFKHIDVG